MKAWIVGVEGAKAFLREHLGQDCSVVGLDADLAHPDAITATLCPVQLKQAFNAFHVRMPRVEALTDF